MTEPQSVLPAIYAGWQNYQTLLTTALKPLTSGQLAVRAAPNLRSIEGLFSGYRLGSIARQATLLGRIYPPLRHGLEIVFGLQHAHRIDVDAPVGA